jgi:hypothetical protein
MWVTRGVSPKRQRTRSERDQRTRVTIDSFVAFNILELIDFCYRCRFPALTCGIMLVRLVLNSILTQIGGRSCEKPGNLSLW